MTESYRDVSRGIVFRGVKKEIGGENEDQVIKKTVYLCASKSQGHTGRKFHAGLTESISQATVFPELYRGVDGGAAVDDRLRREIGDEALEMARSMEPVDVEVVRTVREFPVSLVEGDDAILALLRVSSSETPVYQTELLRVVRDGYSEMLRLETDPEASRAALSIGTLLDTGGIGQTQAIQLDRHVVDGRKDHEIEKAIFGEIEEILGFWKLPVPPMAYDRRVDVLALVRTAIRIFRSE